MKYDIERPYTASFLVIRNADKIAFLLRQNTPWMNGYYGLPSGKGEKGDSFTDTGIQEGEQETGVKVKRENLKHLLTLHRKESGENMIWVDVYFEALEWEGEVRNAEPHIHAELAWFNPKELPENIVPSVRFALEAIETGKTYAEYGWD